MNSRDFWKFLFMPVLSFSLSACISGMNTTVPTSTHVETIPTSTHLPAIPTSTLFPNIPTNTNLPPTTITTVSVPSVFYPIDNIHEVVVRPGGHELYATSIHTASLLIVDIDSPGYPILSEIILPGGEVVNFPGIIFSTDGAYAYMARRHNPDYTKSWGLKDDNYIVVIDCTNRKVDHIITMQSYQLDSWVVPSQDNKWLNFTGFQPALRHERGRLTVILVTISLFSLTGIWPQRPFLCTFSEPLFY